MTCLPGGLPLPLSALAYALFVLLAVVGPGLGLLRLLRLPREPAALVPLGLVAASAAQLLALRTGRPALFALLLGALDLAALHGLWRARHGGTPWPRAAGPGLRGALGPGLALVAAFALTRYPFERCAADGAFLFDPLERVDSAFHAALTWELTQGWPPQVPGLSGVPLDYHVAPHLVRAAAVRWAGVHPYDLLARLDLTLWALALVLAWRAAAAALGARGALVDLLPWTLVWSDAAFLLALQARGVWLAELLGGNLLVALFFANTLVPALALGLLALAALARAESGADRRWLLLAALALLALPFFKVFLAAQLLAALVGAALLTGRALPALVALPGLAATLWQASGTGARALQVSFEPLGVVHAVRAALGLEPARGLELAASALAWALLALGLRVCGLGAAWRALRAPSSARVALALAALGGFVLRPLLRVSADGRFDEAVYFQVQSGALLWFFTLEALLGWVHAAGEAAARGRRSLVALLVAALAWPTSVDFLRRRLETPAERVPAALVSGLAPLARLTRPGEVLLMPTFSRFPPLPVVLLGRRVPYAEYLPYLEQFAPPAQVAERRHRVRRAFKHADEAGPLLRELGAELVCLTGTRMELEDAPQMEALSGSAGGLRLYRWRESAATPRLPR